MKVKMISVDGLIVRALVVDKNDNFQNCENCGGPSYNHPDLAKEDWDWCLNCNDEHLLSKLDDFSMVQWTIEQVDAGKIVVVVTR
tara:strand:- start:429 stop:683 length:255 start_codon:yes stop_codon:yes gene_type:complete